MTFKQKQVFFEKNGQVSLEYLLIVAGFFSALAIIVPLINYSAGEFLLANDVLLSKQIIQLIEKEDNLFQLLANGSKKEFEFVPSKEISVLMNSKKIEIISGKKFEINVFDLQQNLDKKFNSKFVLIIEKKDNKTLFTFSDVI